MLGTTPSSVPLQIAEDEEEEEDPLPNGNEGGGGAVAVVSHQDKLAPYKETIPKLRFGNVTDYITAHLENVFFR